MGLFDIFKKKSMTSNVIEKQLVVTPTPSTTETSEETCDIKNQSFWLLNEKYEPLPKLTLIKKVIVLSRMLTVSLNYLY